MKRFLLAVSALGLALASGCVTHVKELDLTGNVLIDAPHAIASGPPRDKVLWQDRLALADLRAGNFQQAKQNLDDVLLTLGGIYGKDPTAKKARSYFSSENKKTFIGEPYERVMDYYYRGILYWMDGEPDNARACFRTGQLEDSSSEGEQYNSDYVLLDYLDGLASVKTSGDGSDAFQRAENLSRQFSKPPPYNTQANVLFFVEFGPGPKKYASGRYREELHLFVPPSPVHSASINVENQTINIGPYDDLGFQATTRGGRVMDHILGNKAVFKTTTDVVGNTAIVGGAIAAASGSQVGQEVGLGLIAAGIISKVVSAKTRPEADVRTWDNLPRFLSFAAVQLAPGMHTATVEFHDQFGGVLPNLTKTITINVSADKHDKVVFVSDASSTPQSL
jgi:hypothetical protein